MKNLLRCLFFCVLCFGGVTCVKAQIIPASDVNFEIKVVSNSLSGQGVYCSREVYILLAEKDFSSQNLERLFTFMANKYSTPKVLTIKIFTNLESLNKMIDYDNPGVFVDFPNNEAGIQAYKQFDEQRYPKPKGFYAAYYRDLHSEFFIYNPKKDEDDIIIRVTIKSKGNLSRSKS